MKKLLLLAIVVLGISAVSFGQGGFTNSATATASATITTPMEIEKKVDLVFGNIIVGTVDGDVTISPAGGAPSFPGGTGPKANNVTGTGGTPSAASFEVRGAPGASFSIVIPTDPIDLTSVKTASAQKMSVKTFVSSLGATSTLDNNGKKTIVVGATLTVKAGQEPGLYTNTTGLAVTVNYN